MATPLCLGLFTHISWFALVYPIFMYATGLYALIYFSAIHYSNQRKKLRRILKSNKILLEELIVERKKLITMLDDCKGEFEKSKIVEG